jgi:hypothetical protein
MMRRSLADARRWMRQGTALFVKDADLNEEPMRPADLRLGQQN